MRMAFELELPVTVEELWPRLVDHAAMDQWSGAWSSALLEPGSPDPNGLGALREITLVPGFSVREQVLLFEPPRRLDYGIVDGMPGLAHHAGSVVLTPTDGGCRVQWSIQISFRPKHPMRTAGPPLIRTIGLALRRGLRRLARQITRDRTTAA